jgi:hypothetical protein
LRLAVSPIDTLRAVLSARVASVVAIVEIAGLQLSRAVEDASVVVEEQVLCWVAFCTECGGVLAVLASCVVAVGASQSIGNVISHTVLSVNALADGGKRSCYLLQAWLAP